MGLYNYSEAEKVLRVALALKDMLENQTDIGAVYITRTNDDVEVGLTQRTEMANATGADFYYSIHSDAGPPGVNSTLMLWGADGQGVEKFPRGGKKMGDIMDVDLTESMRIGRRGSRADSPFYGATTRTTPYLAVNRLTNMASVLSEAGFHTNPTQQMRNMNAEWKRLEAQSAFWSILAYHGLERPSVGIATGYITDVDDNAYINGATIEINGQSYTTDSFESLFNRYSSNPDALANGFYYLENLQPEGSYTMDVSAPGYYPESRQITLRNDFFTFTDVELVSSVPPAVVSTLPQSDADNFDRRELIQITFSRQVLASSLENQISFTPAVDFTYTLREGRYLEIAAPDMDYDTQYSVTLGEGIEDLAGHTFDGNADGTEGESYTFVFKTGPQDTNPPVVTDAYPSSSNQAVDRNTIISFTLDEPILRSSVTDETVTISSSDGSHVAELHTQVYTSGDLSVIQAFPAELLQPNTSYIATLQPGVTDLNDNMTSQAVELSFSTNNLDYEYDVIDNFNSGISGWWEPQQSGSTVGIITEQTSRTSNTSITNPVTGSTGAMNMNYGWDPGNGAWLIRNYLPPGAPQNASVRVNRNQMLEVYLFGDGSENRFRFMLRDGSGQLEGSPWYQVDWIGWRKVRWDLSSVSAVGWVNGNGTVDGNAYTDSFQMTYTSGAATQGQFIVDDYRVVTAVMETSTDDMSVSLPGEVTLRNNYPNPFNPSTQIQFELPQAMPVQLHVYDITGRMVAQLADGNFTAGLHSVTFNAAGLSSGMYIYQLSTPEGRLSGKMMLVK